MIIICDPICHAGEHVPFNAGILELIRRAFPDEKIFFLGEQLHVSKLKRQVNLSITDSISWVEISIPDRYTGYSKRFCEELRIVWRLIKPLCQSANGILLFTAVQASTLVVLKLLSRFMSHNLGLQVVLHGLGDIGGDRSRHPIRRFQDMRTALTMRCERYIQYLALEVDIKEAILKNMPFLNQQLEVIEHPIPPCEELLRPIDLRVPVKFGFLGRADETRGFPIFLKLASEIVKEYQDKGEFHAIGRYPKKEDFLGTTHALLTKPCIERLERSAFIESAKKLHFVIFPLSPQFYQFAASGSLMDAIAWGRPVIARNIPIVASLFENYGDIGYVFNDERELHEIVRNIIEQCNNLHYRLQVDNIKKIREDRSAIVLAETYRKICLKMLSKL
jgi:glycosyltransferase involved in cell wall biosynthesis